MVSPSYFRNQINIIYNIVRLTSKLEIEKGRYFQINRTEGFCKICNDLEIEDENHFLWQCEKYRKERNII
jgi:hypothetical protein